MSIRLPKPVAAYFIADADKTDHEAVTLCFTESAAVRDESHVYTGRAAIKRWKASSTAKYQYTSQPIGSKEMDGKTVVTCHLVGNFPGSPIDLRYFFELDGDKIASLEIIP